RELRRLAAAGIAADDDDAMARQRIEDSLARLRDRQLGRIVEHDAGRAPRLGPRLGLLEPRVELLDEPERGAAALLALLDRAEQRAQVRAIVARDVRDTCLSIESRLRHAASLPRTIKANSRRARASRGHRR